MLQQNDIAWLEHRPEERALPVPAAKLHVLHLEPVKEKLGARWPRLSLLVHKLFERALEKAQGPRDHYVRDGDLSYVATFHGLSIEEASLACAAVATEVCEVLFGEEAQAISVRSIVGSVPGPVAALSPADGARTPSRPGSGRADRPKRPSPTHTHVHTLARAHKHRKPGTRLCAARACAHMRACRSRAERRRKFATARRR